MFKEEDNSKGAHLVAKDVAFSIATAVERIDELGCIDLFPEESFPTFPGDMSSLFSEYNDTAGDPSPQVPINHQSRGESISNRAEIAKEERKNNASNTEDMQENSIPQDNMNFEPCMTSEMSNDIVDKQSSYHVVKEIEVVESDSSDIHMTGACTATVNSDSGRF